jgi:hypothetical protein
MRHRRAAAPWNDSRTEAAKRGRPRKPTPEINGARWCIWPSHGDGACRQPAAGHLALCPQHAEILSGPPIWSCAWPGCSQLASYGRLCSYHQKRCRGLLDSGR